LHDTSGALKNKQSNHFSASKLFTCKLGLELLALGNWVLGNICRYWVVLLLGDIYCDTQYDTNQTAVSTVHMITILASLVWPLSADNSRESGEGVECKLYIIIIIEF